jgi:hypothetical protein
MLKNTFVKSKKAFQEVQLLKQDFLKVVEQC